MRWPSCWSYHWWFLEGLCSLVNRYIECNQSVITRGCMQRITWFAYYSTFFAMSIIKIHSFPPFCVKSLFFGLFIYYVIFVQSIFCIYTVLTLQIYSLTRGQQQNPFPSQEVGGGGGCGGGHLLWRPIRGVPPDRGTFFRFHISTWKGEDWLVDVNERAVKSVILFSKKAQKD